MIASVYAFWADETENRKVVLKIRFFRKNRQGVEKVDTLSSKAHFIQAFDE